METQGAFSFPVTTGFYSWTFPLWISKTVLQDTPAGPLTVSQMLKSRSAAVVVDVLLHCDTASQPGVNTAEVDHRITTWNVSKASNLKWYPRGLNGNTEAFLRHYHSLGVKQATPRLPASAHVIVLTTVLKSTYRLWAAQSQFRQNKKFSLPFISDRQSLNRQQPVSWYSYTLTSRRGTDEVRSLI